jgi:glycosyltransferase involved in cell wall biosynthesis
MASNKIDAVITTGPPHSTHLIGIKLKNHTGIPWLADFRDPWTNIDFYHDLKLSKFADRLHHKLEKKVLKEADAVSVISPGMVTDFSKIYARKYHIIPNGFDEDDIRNIEVTKTKKFSLAHIGSLTKSRNPENLWKAISILIEKTPGFSNDIEILIIGKIDISAIESLRKYNLEQYLRQIDYMPHDEVIAEQRKASLLLLLINNTPSAKLILTGKIFEYLISNTPIICIGPNDGDAAKVVIDTNSGSVYDFNNESELLSGIAGYYNDYKQGNLVSKSNNLEKYERKRLTGEMSSLLDSMT